MSSADEYPGRLGLGRGRTGGVAAGRSSLTGAGGFGDAGGGAGSWDSTGTGCPGDAAPDIGWSASIGAGGVASEVAVTSPDLATGSGGGPNSGSFWTAVAVPDKMAVRPIAKHVDSKRPLIFPPSIVEMRIPAHSAMRDDHLGITTTIDIVGPTATTRTNYDQDGSKSRFFGGQALRFDD